MWMRACACRTSKRVAGRGRKPACSAGEAVNRAPTLPAGDTGAPLAQSEGEPGERWRHREDDARRWPAGPSAGTLPLLMGVGAMPRER